MWRSRALFVVLTACTTAMLLAPFATAQTGDVSNATITGTWRFTVTIASYSTDFQGTSPASGNPPAGTTGDVLLQLNTTCTAPGQCELTIADQAGNRSFADATTGFAGVGSQVHVVQDGDQFLIKEFGGFGFGPCDPSTVSPAFATNFAVTVDEATTTATGSSATALHGEEVAVVPSCAAAGGPTTIVYRHLTITHAVFVPAASTTTTTGAGGAAPVVEPTTTTVDRQRGPAPIATALTTPADAFTSPAHVVVNAALALAAMLLIVFPAELFNKTFEENHDQIRAGWERRFAWLRRRRLASTQAQRDARRPLVFAGVAVAGAVLGSLLNPDAGLNAASAAALLASLLAFLFTALVAASIGITYRRVHQRDRRAHPNAIPAGLVIASACVLLSRLCSFEPGYLYGLVVGVAFTVELDKREEGQLVAIQSLLTLAVAVVVWVAWVPVNDAATKAHAAFPVVLLDDLLGSIFVAGLVGTVLGLFPLRFMPGHKLASWHRGAWAAVFSIAAFALIDVMLRPDGKEAHPGSAPIVTAVVLFVLFGAGSLLFAAYFSRRKKQAQQAALVTVAASLGDAPPDEE